MPPETELLFPKITQQGLDDLRRRIGVPITDTLEPWCHEATRDNIRHYAHGIGDDNPLWCDPAYAARTRHGGIVALPSLPLHHQPDHLRLRGRPRRRARHVGGRGLDVAPAGAAQRRDLDRRLPEGADRARDALRGPRGPADLPRRFRNQRGETVAEADSWCFRTERDHAREKGSKYTEVKARPPRRYSDEELAEVYRLYANEEVRGATPRYWQDVKVGEALPKMAKGPMTVTGFIAYAQGWGGLYIRANKLAWKQISRHSGLGIKNRFGIPDCPERVHWEHEFATKVGAPGAYDYGPERCSWLTHHLTNWMGDDGFLRRAHCKIRRHNPEGDYLIIEGRVTGKHVEDGRHLVEIEQEARNQDGEQSVLGGGLVELPSRR